MYTKLLFFFAKGKGIKNKYSDRVVRIKMCLVCDSNIMKRVSV